MGAWSEETKQRYQAVAKRMFRLADSLEFSNKDLADMLKVDRSSVINWRAGRAVPSGPRCEAIETLCSELQQEKKRRANGASAAPAPSPTVDDLTKALLKTIPSKLLLEELLFREAR